MSAADNCLLVENLNVTRDGTRILRGLSLRVACAERLIIAGPNGAGKTTLLKALLGLIPKTAGRVRVLGAEVGSREWLRGRRRVGYVNQESVQVDFPISGREVVEIGTCSLPLGRAEKVRLIEEAMRTAGCAHLESKMYDPQLLLLDEPTSSLDPQSRAELMGLLRSLNETRGLTVLMVSHDSQALTESGWRIERLEAGVFA
jgi:ABC-type Mn2+/Zn2+ transport system ATPase subunit